MFIRKSKLIELREGFTEIRDRSEAKGVSEEVLAAYNNINAAIFELMEEETDEFHKYLFANSASDSAFAHLLLDFITYHQDNE